MLGEPERKPGWIDRNYRFLMLWGMVLEIVLIAILVHQGQHPGCK